jgi:hypothetical protein
MSGSETKYWVTAAAAAMQLLMMRRKFAAQMFLLFRHHSDSFPVFVPETRTLLHSSRAI